MRAARVAVWLVVVIAFAIVSQMDQLWTGAQAPSSAEYGSAPSFSLTDQKGRTVTDQQLRGEVWVANFIFSRCVSVCPLLTAKFAELQRRLAGVQGVSYLSFTVDPIHDTPPVLDAFAQKFGADPERWRFLTGPIEQVRRIIIEGFKLHVGEPTEDQQTSLFDIMHDEHFVLVDGRGVIRGYFTGDQAGLESLTNGVRQLSAR